MGQDASHEMATGPPETLEARDIASLAKFIRDNNPRIVILSGAGMSTAAGIPDFRSPDTGLYANLAQLDLPYPEAVFELDYFRRNPQPFYELAHGIYPGTYEPTLAHCFAALLHQKGLLLKLLTQNIDLLERAAGVPDDKVIHAHGSFATQRCIDCKTPFPDDLMATAVQSKSVPRCTITSCNGLVKPDIVFFGEALPSGFFHGNTAVGDADLVIVMGTSLKVQPFCFLPEDAKLGVPRLLINNERAGRLGNRSDDVLCLDTCDAGCWAMAGELGWHEELLALFRSKSPALSQGWVAPVLVPKEEEEPQTADEALEKEVESLTRQVDRELLISAQMYHDLATDLSAEDEAAQGKDNALGHQVPGADFQGGKEESRGSGADEERKGRGEGAAAEVDGAGGSGGKADATEVGAQGQGRGEDLEEKGGEGRGEKL